MTRSGQADMGVRTLCLGLIMGLAAVLTLSLPARAADPIKRAPMLQQVLDCRAIADPGERLACYDASVNRLDQAELAGQVVVVDREKAREVRRQAFGFNLPSLAIFERGAAEPEINNLTTTVVRARQDPLTRWIIEIEGGAVWKQMETVPINRSPKKGMTVQIRKGALGAFFMNVDGQRAFKVDRVK